MPKAVNGHFFGGMTMEEYTDKNGDPVTIGDRIIPDEGRELIIVAESEETSGLIGRQVDNMEYMSLVTAINLSRRWRVRK